LTLQRQRLQFRWTDDEYHIERADHTLQGSLMAVVSGQLVLMVEVVLVRLVDGRLARRSEAGGGVLAVARSFP
jgi:hypothetical protein